MLTLPSSVRIYFFAAPTDMRKDFDGLSALVRAAGMNEFSGQILEEVDDRQRLVRGPVVGDEIVGLVVGHLKPPVVAGRMSGR